MRLETLKQACRSSKKGPPSLLVEHQSSWLSAILSYVDRRANKLRSGVFRLHTEVEGKPVVSNTVLLYWPHIYFETPFISKLYPQVFTADELALFGSWRRRNGYEEQCEATRERILFALRHLLLPLDAAECRPLVTLYRNAYLPPDASAAAYHDDANYTAFRWVRKDPDVTRRVSVQPEAIRAAVLANTEATPGALLALYAAWATATDRLHAPFDPAVVGVDFTSTGHLFVNWKLFMQSSFWPREVRTAINEGEVQNRLDEHQRLSGAARKGPPSKCIRGLIPPPETMSTHLSLLPAYCTLQNGIVDVDVDSSRTVDGKVVPSFTATLCRELAIFDFAEPHSLIDPLFLTPTSLFSGIWHTKRWKRLATSAQRVRARSQSLNNEPLSSLPYYAFTFRPMDYLDDFIIEPTRTHLRRARDGATDADAQTAVAQVQPLLPFAHDHRETIYAVKSKGQMCFIRPRMILQLAHDSLIYRRFLHLVDLEETARGFDGRGEAMIEQLEHICRDRKDYYRDAEREVIYEDLRVEYVNMVARTTPDTIQLLNQVEARLHSRDAKEAKIEGPHRRRWFFERVMPYMTQHRLAPPQLRVVRRLQFPAMEAPQEIPFFTPRAMAILKECALLSMRYLINGHNGQHVIIGPDDPLAEKIERLLHQVTLRCYQAITETPGAAAPFLLAWARFCEAQQSVYVRTPAEQPATVTVDAFSPTAQPLRRQRKGGDHNEWSLAHDVHLLTHYRRYPRLLASERDALCQALERAENVWQMRMCVWQTRLTPLIHQRTWRRLRFPRVALDLIDAWHLVLHWGMYHALSATQRQEYRRAWPPRAFTVLWRLNWPTLAQMVLPTSYHDYDGFRRLYDALMVYDKEAKAA